MVKRMPLPVPFVAVVFLVVALMIYFGAWAVSADTGQLDRTLSLGFGGGAYTGAGAVEIKPSSPSLSHTNTGTDGTAIDTWWGKSLIAACPLH